MNKPTTIIAIDPGLRALGVAVFSGGRRLRHASVLTTSARDSTSTRLRKLSQELRELFALHRPDVVLMEAAWPSKNKSLAIVHRVAQRCKRMCRAQQVTFVTVPTATVRKALIGYGKAGKYEMAVFVASLYPELRIYLHQNQAWKERHFRNLFDAVALGIWYRQLAKTKL